MKIWSKKDSLNSLDLEEKNTRRKKNAIKTSIHLFNLECFCVTAPSYLFINHTKSFWYKLNAKQSSMDDVRIA